MDLDIAIDQNELLHFLSYLLNIHEKNLEQFIFNIQAYTIYRVF